MKLNIALIVGVFVFLIGCGGGGSSSGGSQDPVPTNTSAVDINQLVGTYRGTSNIKVVADLLFTTDTERYTRSVVVTVTADRRIKLNFDNEVIAEGTLTDTGSFFIRDSLRSAGFDCSGTMTIEGAIVGNTVRANINSQNAKCSSISGYAQGTLVAHRS